jgi:CRP-like cAMP-binding protein
MTDLTKSINVFLAACNAQKIKRPNPMLIKFFTEEEPIIEDLEDIDLTGNYIGNRGIIAVLDVVEKAPNFRSLNLSEQKLYNTDLSDDSIKGNDTMEKVINVCKTHPSITSLDISGNPVSNYIGRKLLSLVEKNPRLCTVNVSNTRIDFDLRGKIKEETEKNTRNMWEAGAATDNEEAAPTEFGAFGGFGASDDKPDDKKKQQAPDLSALGGGRKARKTVCAKAVDAEAAKQYKSPYFEKSAEMTDLIVQLLHGNVLFTHLDSASLKTIAGAMQRVEFTKNQDVLKQNEEGSTLFIIQEGSANILKEGQCVFVKQAGTAFGELELMYDSPCAATVRCATDRMVCWALDRDTYRNLVMGAAIRRREEFITHVSAIPLFESLSYYEKLQIADALSTDEWQAGDYIIKFDQDGEWMFIVLEGTAEVIGRENGEEKFVCDFNKGEYFGELEFLNNHKTVADVKAKTYVRTAKVNRRHFEMCMGPVIDVLKNNSDQTKYEHYRKVLAPGGSRPASAKPVENK